jgi:hypothetical protein
MLPSQRAVVIIAAAEHETGYALAVVWRVESIGSGVVCEALQARYRHARMHLHSALLLWLRR